MIILYQCPGRQARRRAGTLFHWFNSIMGNGITLAEDDGDDDVDVNQNARMCKAGICYLIAIIGKVAIF